jgi:ferredoxin-type protein NapH
MWHLTRKTVQTLVFISLIAAPALALYDVGAHTRALYGPPEYSLNTRRIRGGGAVPTFFVDEMEALIGQRPRSARPLSGYFAGSPWAMNVSGYLVIEPLNALGAIAAGGGGAGKILLAALPFLVLTALLGRVFCGWLCPVHFLLEMVDGLRALLARLGVPVRNFRLRRTIKYAALGLGAVATLGLGAQMFPLIYPPAVLGRQMFELIFFGAFGGGIFFLAGLALAEIFLSRRLWCRYLCPGGGLYSLLSPLRVLTIRRVESLCDNCGDCDAVCAFGLSPMTDATGIECTSCLECVRSCPTEALGLRLEFLRGGLEESTANDPPEDRKEAA